MASEKDGDIKRVSTKEWARTIGYDPVKLFNKVPVKGGTLVPVILPGQSGFVAFDVETSYKSWAQRFGAVELQGWRDGRAREVLQTNVYISRGG